MKRRYWDIARQKWSELEIVPLSPPGSLDTQALEYRQRAAAYIHEVYPPDMEAGIQNDAIAAQILNEPLPQEYIDLLIYREECKSRAYLDVYGVERQRRDITAIIQRREAFIAAKAALLEELAKGEPETLLALRERIRAFIKYLGY